MTINEYMKIHPKKYYSLEEVEEAMGYSKEKLAEMYNEAMRLQVAYKIREIRLSKKMTQQMLAEKSGMPRTVISRIESGKGNITIETLAKLADSMDEDIEIRFVKKRKAL